MNNKTITVKMFQLNMLRRYYTRKVSQEIGVYFGQPPILQLLDEHGCMTQKEIADSLHVSPPSVATSVKRMSKTGMLRKTTVASDMRCTKISLTDRGKSANAQFKKRFDEIDAMTLNGLDDEQREMLSEMLDIMINNLSNDEINTDSLFEIMHGMKADNKEVGEK